MIITSFKCTKCGLTYEHRHQTEKGYKIAPVPNGWQIVCKHLLCPNCNDLFKTFVSGRIDIWLKE